MDDDEIECRIVAELGQSFEVVPIEFAQFLKGHQVVVFEDLRRVFAVRGEQAPFVIS